SSRPSDRFNDAKQLPDGTLAYYDNVVRGYRVVDSSYETTDVWLAANGHPTVDHHAFQLLSNGNVVFMIYDIQPADLSAYGGLEDAEVVDLVIQELDQDHNVVFEWNSRDHVEFTDSYVALDTARVDYIHGNAIEEDHDGNFLLSS